jgi:hypothetical protein
MHAPLTALALLTLCGRPSLARDMTGKLGVGVVTNTVGMPMAVARYWRTTSAIELLVSWNAIKRDEPAVTVRDGQVVPSSPMATAVDQNACLASAAEAKLANGATMQCGASTDLSHLRFGFGWLRRIHDAPRSTLAVGVRPWLQLSTETATATVNITSADGRSSPASVRQSVQGLPLQWGIELPLVAEAFFSDHVSLTGHVAIGIGRGRRPAYAEDAIAAREAADDWWLASGGTFSGGAGLAYYF